MFPGKCMSRSARSERTAAECMGMAGEIRRGEGEDAEGHGSMSMVVNHSSGEHKAIDSHPARDSGPMFPVQAAERPLLLASETIAVAAGTIGAVKAASLMGDESGSLWLVVPTILVAAALLPTWIAGRGFPRIGLDRSGIHTALTTVGCISICVLPVVFLGLWLLESLGLPTPLRPAVEDSRNWLTWSVYQFLYVAVAEELFFRGYIQANVARVFGRIGRLSCSGRQCATILASAACFALAHVVIYGRIMSAATFLPGVLLAWLFVRTHTLLAPILFHGLANVIYGIAAVIILA